jgi:hypothetical protein
MNTSITTQALGSIETPLLAVIVAQGAAAGLKDAGLERAAASGDYKGKKDESLLVYGSGKAERILLVGPARRTRSPAARCAARPRSPRNGHGRSARRR